MKAIPILRCSHFDRTHRFYTEVLGFEVVYVNSTFGHDQHFAHLHRDGLDLYLCSFDGPPHTVCIVRVEPPRVDELFEQFLAAGLDVSTKLDSPVHQSPVDQTWGMREFYVEDPDGNTLRFQQEIK